MCSVKIILEDLLMRTWTKLSILLMSEAISAFPHPLVIVNWNKSIIIRCIILEASFCRDTFVFPTVHD